MGRDAVGRNWAVSHARGSKARNEGFPNQKEQRYRWWNEGKQEMVGMRYASERPVYGQDRHGDIAMMTVSSEGMLTASPAYTAANLPDKQVFLDSAPKEIKSGLRKSMCISAILTSASAEDEEYEYAIIIAQLEQELRDIEACVSFVSPSPVWVVKGDTDIDSREKDVEALTKDRDSLVKAKKEIKLKFDLTETWLTDYARVSLYFCLVVSCRVG